MLSLIALAAFIHPPSSAEVTRKDILSALAKNDLYAKAAGPMPGNSGWIDGTHTAWLEIDTSKTRRYVLFNADTQHESELDLSAISTAMASAHQNVAPKDLRLSALHFEDKGAQFKFTAEHRLWTCALPKYSCSDTSVRPDEEEDSGQPPGFEGNDPFKLVVSPDGKWEATIQNDNVYLRSAKEGATAVALTTDGTERDYYQRSSLSWSPDSRHLLALRVLEGDRRMVHYVESSPVSQIQPIASSRFYAKPGDVLDREQPVLFDVATRQKHVIANDLFSNPFDLSRFEWRSDSSAFTFVYNQRGHQRLSVLSVDAYTGKARSVIDEVSPTFIEYTDLNPDPTGTGKYYRHDMQDGAEILWLSERDGWAHLYLYNGRSGTVIRQITHGSWVVRGVDYVDEAKRQIYFEASGVNPKLDPYFTQGYRINFDGSAMTLLTPAPSNHKLTYSSDGAFYLDEWSRVDEAPTVELHQSSDQRRVTTLIASSLARLYAVGWTPPETFVSKGRDGKTDIWGIIWKPAGFNPSHHYPVVEDIYAGPQGSFVPKSFSPRANPLTELGFVVVQIDGMGTNNRSKAFHDVIWKNLKDAGFEDRILWHKAAAQQFPWYDISRVGIYGTSAGGQSALGALLFHPDFYKAAVANSGCHDNRMDKIWWNEQWMGWPVGPEYAASSNTVNAWRLQGKLLLVMGEMDRNVDPSSTLQVVDALIKANKDFELLDVPGGGHGAGGEYGERRMMDFFIRSLTSESTANWNANVPLTNSAAEQKKADDYDPK